MLGKKCGGAEAPPPPPPPPRIKAKGRQPSDVSNKQAGTGG